MNTGRKRLLSTLAALFFAALGLVLGNWQLNRAAQKEALQTAMRVQSDKAPIGNAQVRAWVAAGNMQTVDVLYHPVHLRGRWLPEHTVYLDNRQMQAQVGFFVLTPLRLQPEGLVIMVQRGWVGRNFTQREELPVIETPVGEVDIDGDIALAPSKLYEPGQAGFGVIRQNLDLDQYRAQTGVPLEAFTVRQSGAPSQGLRRQWSQINFGIEKHYGYAFQWFALSALIVALYVWFEFFRRPSAPSQDNASHGT